MSASIKEAVSASVTSQTVTTRTKWSGLKVFAVGTSITLAITLLLTFLVDVNLPKTTWFMEIIGRTALIVFGVLYAFWLEEEDEWWVL
jgi:hypothetical protein